MKSAAHSMKGASGYIGASRIHYACFFVQENFHKGDFEGMLDYYPAVVESVIEFKIHSRQLIAAYKSKYSNKSNLCVRGIICDKCKGYDNLFSAGV